MFFCVNKNEIEVVEESLLFRRRTSERHFSSVLSRPDHFCRVALRGLNVSTLKPTLLRCLLLVVGPNFSRKPELQRLWHDRRLPF